MVRACQKPTKESYTLGPGWYADGLLPCLRWSGNLYPHTFVMPFDVPDPLNNVGKEQKPGVVGNAINGHVWQRVCS